MNAEQSSGGAVSLVLSKAEAVVLFEWLHRVDEERLPFGIEDQAEQRVLWDASACLERVLVEPFDADYRTIVADARAVVRDED